MKNETAIGTKVNVLTGNYTGEVGTLVAYLPTLEDKYIVQIPECGNVVIGVSEVEEIVSEISLIDILNFKDNLRKLLSLIKINSKEEAELLVSITPFFRKMRF